MLNSLVNDPNKLKQTYRTMTMKLQDNPDELNRLNHEYENILNNINDTLVNNFLQPGDNSNIYSNPNSFQHQRVSNIEPKIMLMNLDNISEKDIMNNMMNSMPDMLNMAFNVNTKKNKNKNKNIFTSLFDIINDSQENDEQSQEYEENYKMELEDIIVEKKISIYDIYNESQINISYNSNTFYNGDKNETVYFNKMIKLDSKINDNVSKTYPCEGNKYIYGNKEIEYSNLIVKFILEENIENSDDITYKKINYDYLISLNITFPESIMGLSRNIKLLNGTETKLNIFSNGKIIYNKDTKIVKNKGFLIDNNNYGDIIIEFNILPYKINEFEENKETLQKIFT